MQIYGENYEPEWFHTNWLGKEMVYRDVLSSTNDYVKEKAIEGAREGFLAVADMQSAGRGSNKRAWASPSGSGIWMSFLLRPDIEPYKISEMALLASYCIACVLRRQYRIPVLIKWPNDIVLYGKKVTGILTECSCLKEKMDYVVIGIGINVSMKEFPKEIDETATSLYLACKHVFSRAELIREILQKFEKVYEQYLWDHSLQAIYEEYNKMLVHRHKPIRIIKGSQITEAVSGGINESGELNVILEGGRQTKICAGELSIRGMKSYI